MGKGSGMVSRKERLISLMGVSVYSFAFQSHHPAPKQISTNISLCTSLAFSEQKHLDQIFGLLLSEASQENDLETFIGNTSHTLCSLYSRLPHLLVQNSLPLYNLHFCPLCAIESLIQKLLRTRLHASLLFPGASNMPLRIQKLL